MKELNPIVSELLKNRGVITTEDIQEFISPSPKRTYDPFMMKNLKEACEIIADCCASGEKICIYGDYDADGITSTAIMMQALSELTDNVFYYIPSRFEEGYGLNIEAIDYIKKQGTKLVVTVDCGSVSKKEVAYAIREGLEVIVTDHHNIDDHMADTLIVNPKQEGSDYPFRELAGCGVAFKVVCGLQRIMGLDKSILRNVLDLVAIGTVGDIVPLVDENRTLVKYGIKALRNSRRKGLVKLLNMMNIDKDNITSDNIAYSLVPHLNAAGRMEDASLCVKLLLSDDDDFIEAGAEKLLMFNRERRRVQDEAYEKCVQIVEKHMKERKFILIKCIDAHEGITGIVAGKLKDKYDRPVVIVTPTADGYKGTGRSTSRINLYDLMKAHEEYFEKFGGHARACGFTMGKGRIKELSRSLEETTAQMETAITDMECEPDYDMVLGPADIDIKLYDDIELLAPFGQSNRKPVFCIKNIKVKDVIYIGAGRKHVKFSGTDIDGNTVRCILFNKAQEFSEAIEEGKEITVTGSMDCQVWRDKKDIQIIINHIE